MSYGLTEKMFRALFLTHKKISPDSQNLSVISCILDEEIFSVFKCYIRSNILKMFHVFMMQFLLQVNLCLPKCCFIPKHITDLLPVTHRHAKCSSSCVFSTTHFPSLSLLISHGRIKYEFMRSANDCILYFKFTFYSILFYCLIGVLYSNF